MKFGELHLEPHLSNILELRTVYLTSYKKNKGYIIINIYMMKAQYKCMLYKI